MPIVFGPIIDRSNRAVVYAVSIALAGISLCSTILISDVMSWGIYIVVAFIAMSETMQTLSQQAL